MSKVKAITCLIGVVGSSKGECDESHMLSNFHELRQILAQPRSWIQDALCDKQNADALPKIAAR